MSSLSGVHGAEPVPVRSVVPGELPVTPGPPSPAWRRSVVRSARALWVVAPQWLVARVLVLGALGLAHLAGTFVHVAPATAARVHEGLLGWDAGWYETIARVGYAPLGHQALRFFPLFPLAARALGLVPGISAGVAVVVVANLSALVGTALLRVLVVRETGDVGWADRSVWLLSLAPPAFVLVMGYAEGMLLVCTVGCFLALGTRSPSTGGTTRAGWAWVVVLGFAAGLTRPLGVVLVLPVAVEALRQWWRPGAGWGRRAASVAGVVAPAAGTGTFLAWSAATFGDGLLPVRVQLQSTHHGGVSDPLRVLGHDALGVFHHHIGTALHIPWVILAVVLVVVCFRRLPAAYGVFAAGIVLVALSGTNLDSFERYALSAFPLTVAGASLLASRRAERTVLALAALGLVAYALLAFVNVLVP